MPSERDISRRLAEREGGECEVRTPVGFIDVLTPTVLYEVKEVSGWKGALGQALAYGRYYPNHALKLYLYGPATGKQKQLIRDHCVERGIAVVWHREPQPDDPPLPPKPVIPVANGMRLVLSALDDSYKIRAGFRVNIVSPTAAVTRDLLDSYLDEALAVFDALLDNEFTLTLHYAFGGEGVTLSRNRPNIVGNPVCYRLDLKIMTSRGKTISTSLPGMRKQLPSGERIQKARDYARTRTIPELARLYDLILHPQFTWAHVAGFHATSIQSVTWASVGIRTVNGKHRLG